MSYKLFYDDVDLSAAPFYLNLTSFKRPVIGNIRQDVADLGNFDGSKALGGSRGGLYLRTSLESQTEDPEEHEACLNAFRYLLDGASDKKIATDMLPNQYWLGRPSNEVDLDSFDTAGGVIALNFFCQDPWAYAVDLTTLPFARTGAETECVIQAEDIALSSDLLWPILIFHNVGAVDLTQLVITNELIEYAVTWKGTLPPGHYLKIDCQDSTIRQSSDGATYSTYSMGRKSGRYPYIVPRVDNTFSITDNGSPVDWDLDIIYRERFKG